MPTALVTGASTKRGIGIAVVQTLERHGWNVVTAGFPPSHESENYSPVAIEDDLADPAAPARIFDGAESRAGDVNALVMAHARSGRGGVRDTGADDFDRHVVVNARANMLLIAEFARRFRGDRGSIVSYTSDAVYEEVGYGASKGALDRITIAAALELGPLGITVNAINPGPTDTGWMPSELAAEIERRTPLGRLARPDDSAELVAFLCSPGGGWITGQILRCDGGISLW
jgi:3-oxoacyl-[acyl-carrier protein] reductase